MEILLGHCTVSVGIQSLEQCIVSVFNYLVRLNISIVINNFDACTLFLFGKNPKALCCYCMPRNFQSSCQAILSLVVPINYLTLNEELIFLQRRYRKQFVIKDSCGRWLRCTSFMWFFCVQRSVLCRKLFIQSIIWFLFIFRDILLDLDRICFGIFVILSVTSARFSQFVFNNINIQLLWRLRI